MNRILCIETVLVLLVWVLALRPPLATPHAMVTIPEGASLGEVGTILKHAHIIVSVNAYSLVARVLGGARFGTYVFNQPESVLAIAWRIAEGDTGAPLVKVTIPEGATSKEIGAILADSLPGFDETHFDQVASKSEGYLFPETYFFAAGTPINQILATMHATFVTKTADIKAAATSTRSFADIVTMASILEKEARKYETRQTIAGILWKRIDAGMPLQVDAVFGYIAGTSTFSPTFNQLKVDSPYNTYTHKGLPPGPIGNPGIDAIQAALHPTPSKYWFYLTGTDGTMHYAVTLNQHVANRKYLK